MSERRHLLEKKMSSRRICSPLRRDDTRLELAAAAAGGVHPRRSVRAMPGLEWSQVRVCAFGQKQKLRSQATTELLWWTIQDSNLRLQPQAACIRGDPSGRCPDSNGHKFESVLLDKSKNSAVKRLRSCYGGRYKTRTCDLPHVKRMRYQLRQSSSSLSARDILYHKNRIVKIFLREHFAFCGAEAAEGIIADKAQIMTPETDGGRET